MRWIEVRSTWVGVGGGGGPGSSEKNKACTINYKSNVTILMSESKEFSDFFYGEIESKYGTLKHLDTKL